jgi:hypothetical protein
MFALPNGSPCLKVGHGSESEMSLTDQTPNPSMEGMPKRLRLLCTPHVKR